MTEKHESRLRRREHCPVVGYAGQGDMSLMAAAFHQVNSAESHLVGDISGSRQAFGSVHKQVGRDRRVGVGSQGRLRFDFDFNSNFLLRIYQVRTFDASVRETGRVHVP
jgi:hypothetical protein